MNRDVATIPKRIASIKFSLMDPTEIRKMSAVEVKTADTYKDDGHAYRQGLMDSRMGVIEPGVRCETCGNKHDCLLYTSPSPRDRSLSRMPSSA